MVGNWVEITKSIEI